MRRRLTIVLGGWLPVMPTLPAFGVAAPATVTLRSEGKIHEGSVTTDTRAFSIGGVDHTCDGTNAMANPTPGPTRGAVFAQAAGDPATGYAFSATWSDAYEDVSFSSVAGEDMAFDPVSQAFLATFRNGVGSLVGSCQEKIADGDEVLDAYASFGDVVLRLTGPSSTKPGGPVTLKVTDAGTAAPIQGASVGGQTTGADGTAQVTPAAPRPASFRATSSGAIRSNAAVVCATGGTDGACGTSLAQAPGPPAGPCLTSGRDGRCGPPDLTAPAVAIRGIADGKRVARGRAPRRIRAVVDPDASGEDARRRRANRVVFHVR